MKKLSMLGILILVAMFSFNVKADIITLDGANEIANAFFANSASSQKRALKSAAQLEYAWDSNSLTQTGSSVMKSVEEDPTFYVFNNPDGEGFVIVSGDSNARSVIGYSYEGSVPMADEIPDPMKDYLLGIDAEVKWARTNLTSGNSNLKATEVPEGGNIVKYLETPSWDQHEPFNAQCYTDATSSNIGITGCVPIAYAMIMKYHNWPEVGTLGYTDDGGRYELANMYTGVAISNRTYDWNKILFSYSGTYAEDQADEVAKLVSHIGHAFSTNHNTGTSNEGSSTQWLNYFFGYNWVNASYQSNFTLEAWKEKIRESLNNDCPIPYAADRSSDSGDLRHMFVLDGYADNDYYHFNWGWGGSANGWFSMTAMTSDGRDYSWKDGSDHTAFFNFCPDTNVTVSVAVEGTESVTINGASEPSKEVEAGTEVTLQATGDNFAGWVVDGTIVSTANPYTFTATSTKTYTAKFLTEENRQEIYHNYLQDEDEDIKSNCSVTGFNSESGFGTPSYFPIGVNVKLTANCNRGYKFDGWYTLDNTYNSVLLSKENPYLCPISEDLYSIAYSFSKLSPANFTVTTADADMGTATWSFNGVDGNATTIVYPGEKITLVATPASDFVFSYWSKDGQIIGNTQTLEVSVEDAKTYTANFTASTTEYIVSSSNGELTNQETDGSRYATYNSNQENGSTILTLTSTDTSGNTTYSMTFLNGNFRVNSLEGETKITISVAEGYEIVAYDLEFSNSNNLTLTTENGEGTTTSPISVTGINKQSTYFTISGSQYKAFDITSFSVKVVNTGGSVTPPATQQYTVEVTASPAEGGIATVAVDGTGTGSSSVTVDAGTTVTFYATAKDGYYFVNWTGTTTSGENPLENIPINQKVTLTANFEKHGGGDTGDTPLDRTDWEATASSYESDGEGTKGGWPKHAIDGQTSTFWHSDYSVTPLPSAPHWLQIDMKSEYLVSAINYVSRDEKSTDIQANGNVKTYQLYVSNNKISDNLGSDYVPNGLTPVSQGNFVYDGTTANHKVILETPVQGRYVYLLITDSWNNDQNTKFANCAEFYVYGEQAEVDEYPQLTNVPTIYINTENGVGVTSKDDYVNAYVTVRGAENAEDNITEVLTEIKGRGNSTWGMAKKPYRLKFDEKINFLGNVAKEKNWVLLANYADKTLMRNALAFETARNKMNFEFTPSVKFVDLVLDGEYLGSYMVTDQVEVKTNRVPVTEQETTVQATDPEITGGYLIEVDGFAESETSWFQTTKGMKVTIKYPKDDEINSDQSDYIKNYTQQMENALFSSSFTSEETGWRKYIDEASMVDWYIACELFGNSDAWWSTYMYKERNDVFKFGPLWDFDIAFNNDNRLGDATQKLMRTYAHDPKTWIARWCQDATFMANVKARWAELREDGILDYMTTYIDQIEEYLSESQTKNFEKWNILNTVVYNELEARGSYAAEVAFLKNYVTNRINYLDTKFSLEYFTDFGTSTNADKGALTAINFNIGSKVQTLPTGKTSSSGAIYVDKLSEVITIEPGTQVTSLTTTGSVGNNWMHGYLFVDWNNDKTFTPDLNEWVPTEESELIAYGFWAGQDGDASHGGVDDNTGYNHLGNQVSDSTTPNRATNGALEAFTIPANIPAGDYRARYKLDWNCTNPDAVLDTNMGAMVVDFTLRIEEASETPEDIYAEMCKPTFTGAGNNTYVKAAQVYGKSIEIPSELLNNVQRGYVPTPIEVVAGEEFVLDLTFVQNWNDIRIYQIENEDTTTPAFTYGPYEGSYDDNGSHPDPFKAMVADGIIVDGTTASFPITFSEDLAVGELAVIRVAVGNVNTPCAAVSGEGAYIDFLFVMVAPATSRTISVEANPAEGGTVTGATTAEGPITLTATANEGYEFVNWTVGEEVVGILPTITDNSSENITYIANFNKLKEKAPQLTVVNATTDFAIYDGNEVTNIKDNNYNTIFYSKGSQEIEKYVQVDLGNLYSLEDIVLYFGSGDQPQGAVIEVSQNGTTWSEVASFVNGDIKTGKDGETTIYTYSCSFDPAIARYARMKITTQSGNWLQMQEFKVYGRMAPRTVTVTSSDIDKGSVFITSPKQEGTGTGGTGTGGQSPSVTTNEDVTVLATANPGYRFVNWTIGGNQVGEVGVTTYTYTDDESATITANFEEIPEIYTVSVSSNNRAMGSATMSATTPTVEEGTSVTFTATAYEGYVFVRWQNAQGTQVSTNATYTTTINANTALTAVFQENAGLTGRWYRIKNTENNVYLNVGNTDCHPTGPVGGVNCVALDKRSDKQLFMLEASGANYTIKAKGGNYIYCQDWNVDALPLGYEFSFVNGSQQTINRTVVATPLTFDENGNGTYNIKNGSNYFKVQNVSGTYYPFCDAPSSEKATWVLEPVKISEVSVEKTSENATIIVKTDAEATIKVGNGTKATDVTSATLTIGATEGSVGDDIKVTSIDGYITSIECVENIELKQIPVTVTEIALRNTSAAEVAIDAPLLEKITVVSDADNKVAKVSATSNLSQGVQVVVEKTIKTPVTKTDGTTPTIFNFLSMPFAFNTAGIEYWNGDSWETADPEDEVRILLYDSQIRAEQDYENTWRTLQASESETVAANQGFVIVGSKSIGQNQGNVMKLRFTSAEKAYNGSVSTIEAQNYGTDATHPYDTDWNFNGVPYLTNGVMNGYTLYFHNGYGYEAVATDYALESEKVISAYQSVMYQANIESESREIYITPSSVSRITKAADDVFARAYIAVDNAAPAKIILSDESSENFVVNEDAWYLAPTANAEPAAYFNIGGSDAAVTVQPEATELPMTVYTGAGTQHRIALSATDGEYEVYLKDAVTDEIVCLNDEDYNFTAAAKTTIANRFTVSMVEPTGIIEQAKAEGAIKAVVAGDVIKLYGTEEGDEVTLYTTGGMVITNAVAEDGVTTIETSTTGVLIIKVADQTVKVVK